MIMTKTIPMESSTTFFFGYNLLVLNRLLFEGLEVDTVVPLFEVSKVSAFNGGVELPSTSASIMGITQPLSLLGLSFEVSLW